jgi:hypothetical protein
VTGSALLAVAAAAFNLVCDLHQSQVVARGQKPATASYRETYRIDLQAMRWCSDTCDETRPVVRAAPRELTLEAAADARIHSLETFTINRESGRMYRYSRIGPAHYEQRGTCRVAPFTGFPGRRF